MQDSELMSDPVELKCGYVKDDAFARHSRPQTVKLTRARTPCNREEPQPNRHFRSIFEHLRPTEKGTLNCATVTRCNLTDEQVVFLRPILEKLVTSDHEMDFEEFCNDFLHLQLAKPSHNLAKLFPIRRRTPLISRLARTQQRDLSTIKLKPANARQFYNRQMAQENIKKQFLRSVKQRLEDRELAQCTFKPKIKVYSAK